MSSRTKRLGPAAAIEPFDWGGVASARPSPSPSWSARTAAAAAPPPAAPSAETLDAIERDAFAKGYAQGERAGHEAAAARTDAMLRRLAQTIEDLQALRGDVIQRTERQVVELAVAIARKIVHRETSIDPDLLMAMARVALDRLADTTTASIRLHPDDHAAVIGREPAALAGGRAVQIVADPSVHRGGCVVHSAAGAIDVGVEAQLDELSRALLDDAAAPDSGPSQDDSDRRH